MFRKNTPLFETVSGETIKKPHLTKIVGLMLGGVVCFASVMFTTSSCKSSPCSCWTAGTVGCHKWNTPGCARCWAGWDTGFFSHGFEKKEFDKINKEVDEFFGGIMSKENFEKAKKLIEEETGVPMDIVWEVSMGLGSIVGAGVDAMENCRMACQYVNKENHLNESVWWYADETAINSCIDYAKYKELDIINKYDYVIR